MTHKFFPYDKNYILKEAQAAAQKDLLYCLIEKVKETYMIRYNPLGLEDDAILKIKNSYNYNLSHFTGFYKTISGLYRYTHNETQLEFVFDGRTHFEKFSDEWHAAFQAWTEELCRHHNFIKYVLEAAIFYNQDRKLQMVENRMQAFLTGYFEVKIYKYRGVPEYKIA